MLRLRNNNVECEIPEEMFDLSSLTTVDLNGNNGVSIGFKSIASNRILPLLELHIADGAISSLSGIDEAFGNLTALNVRGNSIGGEFPMSLLNLNQLTSLDLSKNSFRGTIPATLGTAINKLQNLLLSYNKFSGAIPSTFGNLKGLSRLTLEFNNLSGPLPLELAELTSLTQISFNENRISGPMLDFSRSPYLLSIDGRYNMLTGTIPTNLLQSVDPMYSRLTVIDLSNNNLTGAVPVALSRFSSLRMFLFGNLIDEINPTLCSQASGWFFGDVNLFGCDAIMCPPGTFNVFGRQISESFPCLKCEQASYYGSITCSGSRLGVSENSKIILFGPPHDESSRTFLEPNGDEKWGVADLDVLHHIIEEPDEEDESFNSDESDEYLNDKNNGDEADSLNWVSNLAFLHDAEIPPKVLFGPPYDDLQEPNGDEKWEVMNLDFLYHITKKPDDEDKSFNFGPDKADEHLNDKDEADSINWVSNLAFLHDTRQDPSEVTLDLSFLEYIHEYFLTSPPLEGSKVIFGSRIVSYNHGRSMQSIQKDASTSQKGFLASGPMLLILLSIYFLS